MLSTWEWLEHDQPKLRSLILSDFIEGHRYLLFMLLLKLGFRTELPHVLIGLLHHTASVAREVAKECLRQWEAVLLMQAGSSEPLEIHPLAMLFLHGDGTLRAWVVSFAQGSSRQSPELDPLLLALSEFHF